MNISNQSLFIKDDKLKEIWKFEYIPIEFKYNHKFKDMKINNTNITWQQFVEAINRFMISKENKELCISKDKQLRQYFITEKELNNPREFGSKILFYLWDDVFKENKYKLFKKDIRTFSKLLSEFCENNPINIFNQDFLKILREKSISSIEQAKH